MSFQLNETKNRIYVSGGMSTEVCFAKYMAWRTNKVYAGWDINIRSVYPKIIEDTLESVVKYVKAVESKGCGRTILHSPGFMSVPYMTELCDFVYLPSQFLVGFNSFNELDKLLTSLKEVGIKAYAVAGYDICIPQCLVAWIKFLEMPHIYKDLIQNYLQSDNVLLIGVYEKKGLTFGENVIHQYGTNTGRIEENDIYMLHIHSCYGSKTLSEDWKTFESLAPDFQRTRINMDKCPYVGDWESAFDIMECTYLKGYSGRIHYASAPDTLPLYKLSYELTRKYLAVNKKTITGIVSNPYILNTPTYEVHYGYLAYTYWAGSNHIDTELPKLIEQDLQNGGTIWINDQNNQKAILCQDIHERFNTYNTVYINNSNPLCDELTKWVETYKPLKYERCTFVSLPQLNEAMIESGVVMEQNIMGKEIDNLFCKLTPIPHLWGIIVPQSDK